MPDALVTAIHEPEPLTVERIAHASPRFEEVMRIRSQDRAGVHTDGHDATADIYLLCRDSRGIATLRVNQARRGELDCEAQYPQRFLALHRDVVASTSRFARATEEAPNVFLMRAFMREVWRDQFRAGIRVDMVNVHQRMIPYYASIGYRLLCNSFFVHPRIATPSHVMYILADPRVDGPFASVFQMQHDPLFLELLKAALPACFHKACLDRSTDAMLACPHFVCSHS